MKKLYSKKLKAEVFALAPEQLAVFARYGYTVPTAEEVIADAGAIQITPPEGKRAYVVFNFKSGRFSLKTRTITLADSAEITAFTREITEARLIWAQAQTADPDLPKAAPGQNVTALSQAAPATDPALPIGPAAGGLSPEAVERIKARLMEKTLEKLTESLGGGLADTLAEQIAEAVKQNGGNLSGLSAGLLAGV